MINRVGGPALLGAAVIVSAWLTWPAAPAAAPPERLPPPAGAAGKIKYVGVASCSSMACHNFNGPEGSARSEYSTWAGFDKHARAYAVLENERSDRIVRNLYGKGPGSAAKVDLCLKCHATYTGTNMVKGDRFYLGDGVSCESCHGPAENYLTIHYQAGFKQLSPAEKARSGLWPTKDLTFRGQLCTTCHVGEESKEVNHDLIAAGHPRLNFELGGYHGIAHKHWSHADEVARHPDFEARLWLIGQVTSAKAAMNLLRARALGAKKTGPDNKPWPEFAEYACYACHKNLRADKGGTPRQRTRFGGQYPGSFPWGTWYLAMLGPLERQVGGAGLFGSEGAITATRRLMQATTPDDVAVAEQAAAAVKKLDRLLVRLQSTALLKPEEVDAYAKAFLQVDRKDADAMNWDEAAQRYLAIAAMNNSLSDSDRPGAKAVARREAFGALKRNLRGAFPPGYDSPENFNPLSPSLFEQLQQLRKQFGN